MRHSLLISDLAERKDILDLTKFEQETIIIYNASTDPGELYTCDPNVMRKMDALVKQYPDKYKVIKETSFDKTYSFPKSFIRFRKPLNLSEEQKIKIIMTGIKALAGRLQ